MSTYLRTMATAVTFIEDHLQEDIKVADIAASVSYSLYHFCRVFNQTVHHPPYDYLMRRRLTAAALQLIAGKQRITDIAFAYRFGSPESFSCAFRRLFSELPNQWRKKGLRDPHILMRPITAAHLAQRNKAEFQRPTLIQKPKLTVVGLMTIAQDETAVTHLRRQLNHPPTLIITHYPDYWAEQGKPVLAGIAGERAAAPFVSQTLPAYAYACFSLPEALSERPLLTDYIYQTWLPQSGYKSAAPLELEQDQQLFVPIIRGG